MTETAPLYRANADTGDEQAVPLVGPVTIRQPMEIGVFKNVLILSPTDGGPISADTLRRITEGIHDCEDPFPPAPTLPPIGTWGQYLDDFKGEMLVRPAVVTGYRKIEYMEIETILELQVFRWISWIPLCTRFAPTLTPGCWSPQPAWTPPAGDR